MKSIELNLNWETVVRLAIEIIEHPQADASTKSKCKDELLSLAKIVDLQNEESNKDRWTTLDVIIAERREKGVM